MPRIDALHPSTPPQTAPSKWMKLLRTVIDIIPKSPYLCPFNKGLIPLYAGFALCLGWLLLPLPELGANGTSASGVGRAGLHDYFANFEGSSECTVRAVELYTPLLQDHLGFYDSGTFCHSRKQLLKALSEGGRVGFDAPYSSRDCTYRWFEVQEMCFILERFDGVVFVGDDTLQTVYSGLNILLRRDLALGSLDTASMDRSLQEQCRCNNQFIKQDCRQHYLADSEKAGQHNHFGSPYFCNHVRHAFLWTDSAQPSLPTIEKFNQIVSSASRNKYRPIPIIHSLRPSSASVNDATTSLVKFVELADDSGRNTPMLWIGPTAAGHIELKGRRGNQEIWDFDRKMAATAEENDIDVLGMWNMTVQATSWDGVRFGEKVAITQAMMVVNWLSRLESS